MITYIYHDLASYFHTGLIYIHPVRWTTMTLSCLVTFCSHNYRFIDCIKAYIPIN